MNQFDCECCPACLGPSTEPHQHTGLVQVGPDDEAMWMCADCASYAAQDG